MRPIFYVIPVPGLYVFSPRHPHITSNILNILQYQLPVIFQDPAIGFL